jgi:hypothetical protein
MITQKMPENADKFICERCDFKCCKKSNYDKHLLTLKHKNNDNGLQKNAEKMLGKKYKCNCGKEYLHRQGLYAHKKICIIQEIQGEQNDNIIELFIKENSDFKSLMFEMMKNNTNLQSQMLELCKNSNHTTHNNNSHNKTFNMQFFLNEQCKDAMNITEFVDSFQLQFSDLERVGQLGYVDGISDIIIKKLNEMDIYKRPIHCSDTKRDIMYVRAENVWEKETNSYDRLRLLVRQVTHKNIKLIPLWAETHPQAKDHQHPLNDNYLSMVSQAMGGRTNLEESENKIIRKIAKTVYIDKY